ncbi:unnamed protein product [Boreogadus saida]
MLVSGRSKATRGFSQWWRSVALSQTAREWWWMAYTADIPQSEPESVKCVTLIGAMGNTSGGGRGRRADLSPAFPREPHARTTLTDDERPAGTAVQTGATSLSQDKTGPAGETKLLLRASEYLYRAD